MIMLTLPTRRLGNVLLPEIAPKLSHYGWLYKYLMYQDVTTVIVQVLGVEKVAGRLQQQGQYDLRSVLD